MDRPEEIIDHQRLERDKNIKIAKKIIRLLEEEKANIKSISEIWRLVTAFAEYSPVKHTEFD